MISCTEAVRRLWEYLDGTVGETDRSRIEEHLAFCRRCCGEVEFAHELQRFMVGNARDEVPPELEAHLLGVLDAVEGRR